MAIWRNKNKLLLDSVKHSITTATYQDGDFPLIELKLRVTNGEEGKKKRGSKKNKPSDVEEVILTMTLFEANELLKHFQLIVSNTTRLYQARSAINIPWADGGL